MASLFGSGSGSSSGTLAQRPLDAFEADHTTQRHAAAERADEATDPAGGAPIVVANISRPDVVQLAVVNAQQLINEINKNVSFDLLIRGSAGRGQSELTIPP